jgi:FlaA1/EpsC-like NDP-sugar epimerase
MFYWIRIILMMLVDSIMINLSVYLALVLRFDGQIEPQFGQAFLTLIPWITIITLASLYFFRLYHRMWQYASLGEMYGIVKAATTSMLILVFCIYTIPLPHLPRSVYILAWILIIAIIGASRLGWRVLRDSIISEAHAVGQRALIIGAGDAGAMLARELMNNPSLKLTPVGFVDDARLKQKLTLYGFPVLGNRHHIPHLVEEYDIQEIIIAMPSAEGKVIREIVGICSSTPARVRTFQGTGVFFRPREMIRDIQLEDLLRREPLQLNLDEIALYLTNKSVLVTGAGGSIGSELCRQVCAYQPGQIILLDYSENNLFDIEQELTRTYPELNIVAELTDVKDHVKLEQTFLSWHPQVVFHAAAHKHVPLMESNPVEAVKNNVVGTRNLADLADRYAAEVFIFISTDKAVNPTSVMGATKRIAELLIQELNQTSSTRLAAVRFGNVLGSRGSVIPTFEQQIARGGPVTVTHPDMNRYFMTIPEAVQLVIQAGAMAGGGEIFVLDMGEPVKIVDLARDLIFLHGLQPDKDIKIEFTGIRPGEKLYEELFNRGERRMATRHDRIFISGSPPGTKTDITGCVNALMTGPCLTTGDEVRDWISQLLPEYQTGPTTAQQVVTASV